MRTRLSLILLPTLFHAQRVKSLPNEIHFRPIQSHESTLNSTSDTPQTVFTPFTTGETHRLRTWTQTVYQPRFVEDVYRARERSLKLQQSEPIEWVQKDVLAPDVTDRLTLQELAKMTANAYAERGKSNWYEMSERWNTVCEVNVARRGAKLGCGAELSVWLGGR